MMNVLVVRMNGFRERTTEHLWQYDYGQIMIIEDLDLPENYQVHFCNDGDAETVTAIGNHDGVMIPDSLLKTGKGILAYIYLHEGETDGETEYRIKIPIWMRQKPTDIEPTPEEQSTIDQLVTAMNNALERSDENAESAGQSAENAEAWAVGERGGVHVEPPDETYQNNAKYWAQVAGQGAEGSGYAWFDVCDSDGHMYVTITPDLANDIDFEINEETGHLEVIY